MVIAMRIFHVKNLAVTVVIVKTVQVNVGVVIMELNAGMVHGSVMKQIVLKYVKV